MRPVLWVNIATSGFCALSALLVGDHTSTRIGFTLALINLAWVIFVMNMDAKVKK